ncbi:MAG: preprotein translocase subunit SecG [Erysipelotrichaceae bacterium]|jgi:preprotein translocase subunit SecG|nr:preprotein translocase subunit SecG [Erysipelotrichaceae bacterium]MBQ9840390.1 preprotein translocase subunit SecG [Erysipelotrichaceae bacterium]
MLDIILLIVAILIILLTLLQSGKSEGMSGAFTGGSGLNLFTNVKERGPEKIIANATLVLGFVFFALVIAINLVH